MEKEKYLTYCGLYCELWGMRNRMPVKAKDLLETLKRGDFEDWGPAFVEYKHFWQLLQVHHMQVFFSTESGTREKIQLKL